MKKAFKLFAFFAAAAVVITSCKKEKTDEEDNDNELITTVQLRITESGSNSSEIYTWQDLDGAGGNQPLIDAIELMPNMEYDVQVAFLDESKSPPVSITAEVADEKDVHRLYYQGFQGLTVSNYDTDSKGLPFGLNTKWTTTTAGQGTIKITLRHYAEGGKEASDPVNSSKSTTDAEVEFNVSIAPL